MYTRQGRFWQIANHRFLVAWNGIKIVYNNTVFYVYLKKLARNWSKFSSTVQVLNNIYHKKCLEQYCSTRKNYIFVSEHKKLYYFYSFLWDFMEPNQKTWDYDFFENIPKSSLFSLLCTVYIEQVKQMPCTSYNYNAVVI